MAEASEQDKCLQAFRKYVRKEHGASSNLTESEANFGKGTTVRKILIEVLGERDLVSFCEASVTSKHQDKKTKKLSAEDFFYKVLPELAAEKAKKKKGGCAADIEKGWRKKIVDCLGDKVATTKTAAVVDRLTDTKAYTGTHGNRFDECGKGKGKEGREDAVDTSGYVGNYKGQGTFDQKKK